jgi:hypothetical protein
VVPKRFKQIKNEDESETPSASLSRLPLLAQQGGLGNHVSDNIRLTGQKTNYQPFQKFVRRFTPVGQRQNNNASKDLYYEKAAKLLPPSDERGLSGSDKKWISKANLPSLDEIRDAQSICTTRYFNQLPNYKRNRLDQYDLRSKLVAPSPPPDFMFNQPADLIPVEEQQ